MSLRKNVLANYLSQLYVTGLGFIVVPIYLKLAGADTYGLISVFSTIQAIFGLLDVGLSPTLARDSARLKSGAISIQEFERTFFALRGLFITIGLVGSIIIYFDAHPIASHWLKSNHLSIDTITRCIEIMSIAILFRWQSGLYRGIVTGHEQLVWISAVNSIVATLRFIAPIPLLAYSTNLEWFFAYQSTLAFAEFIVLREKSHSITGTAKKKLNLLKLQSEIIVPLREKARLSASLALTSGLWILVTQTDKIILSGVLSLDQYAYFSQAALASSAVLMLSGPITSAFIPKIIGLSSAESQKEQIACYRQLTSLVATVIFPITATLALCSKEILEVWTRNQTAAAQGQTVMALYSIGYAILSISSLASHLQVASGKMELHIKGSIIYATLFFSQLFPLTIYFGATGAGIAWLSTNAIYMLLWVPRVHKIYMPEQHIAWLFNEILPYLLRSALPAVAAYLLSKHIFNIQSNITLITVTAISSIGAEFISRIKSSMHC